ncbi:MAG: dTMP kinase, partial [Nitrospinae bacterium]|nr:dTMP kinase [Nitrospinota bacterium]
MAKGILITFEGMEGSGKTTHAALLAERLRGMGHDPLLTREPGGTQLGQRVREILLDPRTGELDPLTELLLFSAARRELVTQIIAPALAEGRVVLCDRYADSTRAYQGHGRGVDRDLIGRISSLVIAGATPARTLLFDLTPEEGLARA